MILAATHALRGYDAIQLAAAVAVHARGISLRLPVLTLIFAAEKLNAAATIMGSSDMASTSLRHLPA
jgi:hypothetical protein